MTRRGPTPRLHTRVLRAIGIAVFVLAYIVYAMLFTTWPLDGVGW